MTAAARARWRRRGDGGAGALDITVMGIAVFVPVIQVLYLVAVILAVIALLSIPGSVPWSTSRLRIGLDMATVLLAGAVFLWYFSIAPVLERDAGALQVVSSLAQSTGVLVAVFVVARAVVTGTRGVRRAALAAIKPSAFAPAAPPPRGARLARTPPAAPRRPAGGAALRVA